LDVDRVGPAIEAEFGAGEPAARHDAVVAQLQQAELEKPLADPDTVDDLVADPVPLERPTFDADRREAAQAQPVVRSWDEFRAAANVACR
jgi:hypothetical protein